MAAQRRKKTTRRHGASRPGSKAGPAFAWFLAGLLIGLGISAFLFTRGYLPERPGKTPPATTQAATTGPALIDESEATDRESEDPHFDFFTVLPEMEVIVPDQELSRNAAPSGVSSPDSSPGAYILQAGSFRNAADADQLKARLALQGIQATIQVVTVNDETWHRVRVGPVDGARRADELRRLMQDNGIDTLVMKASS